jgi:hypothetical protein
LTVRQEIHTFIDDIAESKLIALKPLLCALADDSIVIETDLTQEEKEIVAKSMTEYEKNPNEFIPLGQM